MQFFFPMHLCIKKENANICVKRNDFFVLEKLLVSVDEYFCLLNFNLQQLELYFYLSLCCQEGVLSFCSHF